MIRYAIDTARQVSETSPVLVIGHAAEKVRQVAGDVVRYVIQEPQLGTGHALQQTRSLLEGNTDLVLVTTADMPLLSAPTLRSLVSAQVDHAGPLTLLTVQSDESHGFGRVLRDEQARVRAIVEEAQATPEQLAIHELNTSVYVFEASWLWEALRRIPLSPKGEYYLTDLVGIAVAESLSVQTITLEHPQEVIGNQRSHSSGRSRGHFEAAHQHELDAIRRYAGRSCHHLYRSGCKIRSGHDRLAEHLSAGEHGDW